MDFSYEVSRSLAACEGALLVVDATQGIQAQTLANVYLAMESDLKIIPVVNKIDLGIAEPERVSLEVQQAFGFTADEVQMVSAKSGQGIDSLLQAIAERIPGPNGESESPLRALIFDSKYDTYKGVVAYVRVMDGEVSSRGRVKVMTAGHESEILEVGYFQPNPTKVSSLKRGEVGYIATGLKSVGDAPVGDTLTMAAQPALEPLRGYEALKPMVFASLYPADGEENIVLREALEKLQLNDAALTFTPESSLALGTGFRCGFLGLLHMDIVQERLEREYDVDLLATSPSVGYNILLTDDSEIEIDSPAKLPPAQRIAEYREPWLDLSIITPAAYVGPLMELVQGRRGVFIKMEYLQYADSVGTNADGGDARVLLEYEVPLAEVLMDFYDLLKAKSSGYASMDYTVSGYRGGDLVKLDILVAGEPVDALSVIVHRGDSFRQGKTLVDKLKELIPRQMFEVPIQAAIGNKIIARENIRALRKDVLAKLYGGDVTRKRKLLEKQVEGKRRMKRVGTVEIPQEAFLSILKVDR